MDIRSVNPTPYAPRYCEVCQRKTPHEIRAGAGLTAKMCVTCLETGRRYELRTGAAPVVRVARGSCIAGIGSR